MTDRSRALDHEILEQRVLARMESKLQDILPDGIVLNSVIHSAKDNNYKAVLATKDGRQTYVAQFPTAPTTRQLHLAVAEAVKVFRKGARHAD